MTHPYQSLPTTAYWRSAVAEVNAAPQADYCAPKWRILPTHKIATAGSCFAQHIGRRLTAARFNVLDAEPAPRLLPKDRHIDHGYGLFSARYGNIYTARQMLQIAEEALGERPISEEAWEFNRRFVDPFRPTIDPEGHATPEAVHVHRRYHIGKVRQVLESADLLVFTLGLTESWQSETTGRVYPVCPGVHGGAFDPHLYRFHNLSFQDTLNDLIALRNLLHNQNRSVKPRILLTVSPVPLTATASGRHVMQATVYSKSVLRAVAGQMVDQFEDVDYFPSYEIVCNPWGAERRYAKNLRSVTEASVDLVMKTFMQAHSILATESAVAPPLTETQEEDAEMLARCDEELLDAFRT